MVSESAQLTLLGAILAVAISDISLAFDNALANSQMVTGLPCNQQKRALIFGMLLSCSTMIVLTFIIVKIRSQFDWVRYPAGLWLLYVVYKLWIDEKKIHPAHSVANTPVKAVFLIALTDLTMMADNAVANSEFALRAGREHLWTVLIFGLTISCVFMIFCTYVIVWIRKFADWIRYPAGLWLLYVTYLIFRGIHQN